MGGNSFETQGVGRNAINRRGRSKARGKCLRGYTRIEWLYAGQKVHSIAVSTTEAMRELK